MLKQFIFIAAAAAFLAACNTQKGTPVEFSKACDMGNDGKYFEIPGYVADDGSVFCSNIGGRMECGFKLVDSPGSRNSIKVDIAEGSGANSVTKLESGYKKSDIKIRDNGGGEVALEKDQVKMSGKLSVAPGAGTSPGVCFMQVDRIDR
ncbi:MAG TPA: hypothetical protein VGO43_13905 [Pyrinomonadaceae bacterium]|jgi:hypothetical protein|nr:hypothetical protein [Pyrinomonadaceae bacterium]